MNPKLTITVDAKNRALSVASGMITVGAKIDVEISGLPGDIPPWGASDAFSGPSARFRLVDECGRDLARYPLAEGDRWEQSGGVLSSLTPVEFDTDRLRCAFRGVAFDDTLPFGVIVDSAVDAAQYAVGRVKVRQWAAASTEYPTVLPDWRETLERLQKDLAEVSAKRDDAVAAKAAAESAASDAQSRRNEAAASASSALAAKNGAEAARDRAEAASADFDGRLKDYAKKADVESVEKNLESHAARKDNPHGVTAAQVGAFPKSNSEAPTTYELGWNPVFGGISIFDPDKGNVTGAATVYADGKIVQRVDHTLTIPDKSGTLATTADVPEVTADITAAGKGKAADAAAVAAAVDALAKRIDTISRTLGNLIATPAALAAAAGVPDAKTLDEVRSALGLDETATVQDAVDEVTAKQR